MRLRREYIICWDVVGAALDGGDISRCVPLCVSPMCMHRVDEVPLGRGVPCMHDGQTVGHPLKFP